MNTRNCWEFKNCGREPGGDKASELGACPAAVLHAGDACWLIAGTFCGGQVQGTFAAKRLSCVSCEFYQSFSVEHRGLVQETYGHRLGSKP